MATDLREEPHCLRCALPLVSPSELAYCAACQAAMRASQGRRVVQQVSEVVAEALETDRRSMAARIRSFGVHLAAEAERKRLERFDAVVWAAQEIADLLAREA